MKILIVNTYYYPNMIGGTEQSIKLLAEGLKEKGHDVYVLTGDKQYEKYEEINDIKIIRLDLSNKKNIIQRSSRKILEFNNISIRHKLSKILEEINPDIIHTNNLFYISPIIWKIAKERNIKVVHTLRDYWGICPKCTLLNRKNKICNEGNILCKIHKLNYKSKSKYVNVVTSPSKFTLDLYNKNNLYNNIPNKLIYNAIDIDLEDHRDLVNKKLNSIPEKIKFVFMGSLETHKGIEFLIETFKKIENNNIELIICGDGSLKSYVEESCILDKRIVYKGKVNNVQKIEILKSCNVMVVPSIWYEPFGRVVIEGYKYAMPVIACKMGGIKELLDKEVSIGIDVNSKSQLEEAINYLSIKENIDKFMVNTEKFIKSYDLKKQINSFNKLYKDIK